MPLTRSVIGQMMARFQNLLQSIKSQDLVEKKVQKGSMRFEQVQRFI